MFSLDVDNIFETLDLESLQTTNQSSQVESKENGSVCEVETNQVSMRVPLAETKLNNLQTKDESRQKTKTPKEVLQHG